MAWKLGKMAMTKKCVLFGADLFTLNWTDTGTAAEFKDPLHGNRTTFPIYSVIIDDQEHRFGYQEVMPGKHIFIIEG